MKQEAKEYQPPSLIVVDVADLILTSGELGEWDDAAQNSADERGYNL